MNYFLPSWYQDEDSWDGWDQVWFRQPQQINFDDTVNQVRMFYQVGQKVTLLVPAYFPGLRHFLHQQGIFEVPTVSLFDFLQGVDGKHRSAPIHIQDLPWPDDAEFVYGPQTLLVYRAGKLSYHLYQGTEGNLVELERLRGDQVVRRLWFDDRGFVSRVDDQIATGWRKSYLDPTGAHRVIVEPNGRVTTLDPAEHACQEYANITAMVAAALQDYFNQLSATPRIYLAADRGHSTDIVKSLGRHHYALSYFYHRANPVQDAAVGALSGARLVVADSDYNRRILEQVGGQRILEAPPFDTRLRLGTSNQSENLTLFFLVAGLDDRKLRAALKEIIHLMELNKEIALLTVDYSNEARQRVEQALATIQEQAELKFNYVLNSEADEKKWQEENKALDSEGVVREARRRPVIFESLDSELKTINLLQPSRLVIDLSAQPDVYLQIAAISAGIPQINRQPSMYVDDHRNGLVISDQPGALKAALKFYLNGLKNWNAALVYTTQKLGTYTGNEIVEQIKNAMEGD